MAEGGDFAGLVDPSSVAIVGLSADPGKHGSRVLRNLREMGYAGQIWGVNPGMPDLEDTAMFPSLSDLPAAPTVVVCATPAPAVPGVVRDAGDAGARAVIVFAGGFAEAGESGRLAQQELVDTAHAAGVRILGPNSGGVIQPAGGVALSFLTCLDRPREQIRPGPVALVTQSGGTGSYLHNLAADAGSGFAVSISTGNEADLGVAAAVEALALRPDVKAIAVVLEVVRDGAGFLAAIDSARRMDKPVIVCRLGRSEQGRRMVESHSGTLADPARVFDGVCASLGVTVTTTPGELFAVAEVMARAGDPEGGRVGVVTHSGGAAILLADLAAENGLLLPPPSTHLAANLSGLLDHGSAGNPLDMGGIIGGPGRFPAAVSNFAGSGDYDVVLAVSTAHPPAHSVLRAQALAGADANGPPIVHLWMAGDQAADGLAILREHGAALAEEPRAAILAIAGLIRRRAAISEAGPAAAAASPSIFETPTESLSEHDAKELLSGLGIPVVPGALARSPDEAVEIATEIGLPVVVKVSSPEVIHKASIGGVRVGIDDLGEVGTAFDEVTARVRAALPEARIDGARVEQHRRGAEMIVGGVSDETFGPVVLIGLGGALAEVVDDVVFTPAPVAPSRVERLLGLLRSKTVAGDVEALAGIVSRLSEWFAAAYPAVAEAEINPLVWTGDGWEALDAVVRTSAR